AKDKQHISEDLLADDNVFVSSGERMTAKIFSECIARLSNHRRLQDPHDRAILLLDSCTAHRATENKDPLNKIPRTSALYFTSNLTNYVQPLDCGIIATLKSQVTKRLIAHSSELNAEASLGEAFAIVAD
ncbi:hypothetical protein GGI03_009333, partial [Coemansia sp. RSA 2337]